MGVLLLFKKITLLFLIASASFLSTSFADQTSKLGKKLAEQETGVTNYDQEISSIHERLLRVNTKDYGNYDPAPALVRPPFKLIPN